MVEIYDVETISNFFSYVGMNRDSKVISKFVICKFRNDLEIFIEHLNSLKGLIGFNNLSFDSQIIQYIQVNYKRWLSLDGDEISGLIYNYSQKVIIKSNAGGFSDYPEWKLNIKNLDLFKIWHFNNKQRMTSLKWCEFSLDMDSIEEMPIKHYEEVTEDKIDSILLYNEYDVKATYELYKVTTGDTEHPLYKGIDKIQLRKDIISQFGINCINYNDVKIGDTINKLSYCNIKQIDVKDIPKPVKDDTVYKFKDCFPSYMKFKTTEFNNFVNALSSIDIKIKKSHSKTKKDQEFEFTFNSTTYCIAKGGIHSKDLPRKIIPKENEILRDADIGSQYPWSLIKRELHPRHLGKEWLIGYRKTFEDRIKAKREGKKSINEAYKLSLNGGGYGKLGEEYNWQFDPYVMNCVTIGNQVEILMLIESLELNKIHVVSANTDGIVCLFDKSLEEVYYKTCKEWEILVGNDKFGQLEYCDYKLLIQTSVNDYLAVKYNGEIKQKGDFVTEFELHKNKSARIVPLALEQYFINNIPIEKTIRTHNNIYDFCLGVKSIEQNRLVAFNKEEQTEVELQKINRFYVSNKGIHIIKKLPKLDSKNASNQFDIFGNIDDGTREAEVEASYTSTIFNKYVKKELKEYDINYKYYIDKCSKIIDKIGI